MAGIYIHIPFCHAKCSYCDFYSGPLKVNTDQYVDALLREWDARKTELNGETVNTIYIGGGTPSLLSMSQLDRIIDRLPTDKVEEFTIEANPEDISDSLTQYIASSPITRVSMGVQSFHDNELKAIGRRHSAYDAIRAVERLYKRGIMELSLDLIFGLPLQTAASWRESISQLMQLDVPHFSAYLLSYEPGTRLYAMREAGKIAEADEDEVTARYRILTDTARAHGYEHYEISNYARPGHHSRHNSGYWEGVRYIGLGTGAHSFDGMIRRANPPLIKQYITHDFTTPFYNTEEESADEIYNDYIITSLRTAHGIDLEKHKNRYGDELLHQATPYIESGDLIIEHGKYMRIPEHRWLIADRIMTDFMRV